jgi:hypothetical protein
MSNPMIEDNIDVSITDSKYYVIFRGNLSDVEIEAIKNSYPSHIVSYIQADVSPISLSFQTNISITMITGDRLDIEIIKGNVSISNITSTGFTASLMFNCDHALIKVSTVFSSK